MFYDNSGAPVRKHYTLDEFGVSNTQAMGAAFSQSLRETFSSATWRDNELIRANIGEGEVHYGAYSPSLGHSKIITGTEKKLTTEQAEEQIRDSGLPLKVPEEGFTQKALDIVMERKREELVRKKQMDDASGFVAAGGKFAASMVAQILDPVNVAASFVPVIGPTKYAAWIAAQTSAAGRAGVRAGVGAIEGLAGAAIVEPAIYTAMTREQADYTMADSLINVGLGTVLGGGLHMGIGAASDALRRTGSTRLQEPQGDMAKVIDNASPETRQAMLKTAASMEAQGYKLDVTSVAATDPNLNSITKAMKQESSPGLDVSSTAIRARAKALGFNIADTFYHGTAGDFSKFQIGAAVGAGKVTDKVPTDAIFLSSNPTVASQYAYVAGRKLDDEFYDPFGAGGKISEGANVMPVYAKMDNPLFVFDALSQRLSQSEIDAKIKEAREGGHDSIVWLDAKDSPVAPFGSRDIQSNVVAILKPENVRSKFDKFSDELITPSHINESQAIQNTVHEGYSPSNKRGADVGASKEATAKMQEAEQDINANLDDIEQIFAEYEKMTGSSTDLRAYDEAIQKAETDAQALKAATVCRLTK